MNKSNLKDRKSSFKNESFSKPRLSVSSVSKDKSDLSIEWEKGEEDNDNEFFKQSSTER